jgi:hypothetical protein
MGIEKKDRPKQKVKKHVLSKVELKKKKAEAEKTRVKKEKKAKIATRINAEDDIDANEQDEQGFFKLPNEVGLN